MTRYIFVFIHLCLLLQSVRSAKLHCGSDNQLNHPEVIRGHFMVRMREFINTHKLYEILSITLNEGYTVHSIYENTRTLHLSTATNDTVIRLLKHPDVDFVECDRTVSVAKTMFLSPKRNIQETIPSWGLDRINQRALPLDNEWNYSSHNGTGVHIFIIDTGISYSHPEFQGRLSDGYNTIWSWKKRTPDWEDGNGHGSHCAGIAAGDTFGVANGATLHAVRVLNDRGWGPLSGVIKGVDWVTSYRMAHPHPSVASLSLGTEESPSLNAAIYDSILAGVVYSVAAGNEAADACTTSPASTNGVIAVSAIDIDDLSPSWANYGDCVDIYAPGVAITSAWKGRKINTISGTSMACPHVTGAIALLLQEKPTSTPLQVSEHLIKYSTYYIPTNRNQTKLLYTGNGYLTQPVPEQHSEVPNTPPNVCKQSTSNCIENSECCSGHCWKYNSSCR